MRIAYLVHDLADPAVARRVAMLRAGGAEVVLAGFRRGGEAAEAGSVDLGRTFDGRFGQRIAQVVRNLADAGRLKRAIASADVVMARNLEMMALAARVRPACASLVYECLDVHRLMLRSDAAGHALRALERRLLAASDLLVVSSPAFVERHFAPRYGTRAGRIPPVLLVENKVLELEGPPPNPGPRPPGPPWRIGWYGALRCRRSLQILGDLAARRPDLVRVTLGGRPARTEFDDFDAAVARTPALTFEGPYAAGDLPALYGGVHFTWAIDWFEAGANSAWLLPNRLYEGGRFGAVPLALRDVETGRWLAQRGLGVLMNDPAVELEALLEAMAPARYAGLAATAAAQPPEAFAAGREDCRTLVSRLAAAAGQRKACLGVDADGTTVAGGMPCSET